MPELSRTTARHAAGFTLVEALAAGVILSISAAMIGMGVSQSMVSLQRADDYQKAAELLDDVLTRIDIIGPERLLREGPDEGDLDNRFRWKATIKSRFEGDLYDVTVRILWTTPDGERSVQGHTMLNDPLMSKSQTIQWDDL